jgi:hypothetical protein
MRAALIVLGVAMLLWATAAYQLHVYFWVDIIDRVATGEGAFWFPLFYGPFLVIYFVAPFVVAGSLLVIAFLAIRRWSAASS